MKLICPKCGKVLDVNKDELMGRYIVCRLCRYAFKWEKHLKGPQGHKPHPV